MGLMPHSSKALELFIDLSAQSLELFEDNFFSLYQKRSIRLKY